MAIGGLVLSVGVVLGLNYLIGQFEKQTFSRFKISPAEMDEWLKEPIKVTEAQRNADFKVMSDDLLRDIADLNDLGWKLTEKPYRAGYIDVETSSGLVPKRFREWAYKPALTPEEQTSATAYVNGLKAMLPMVEKLAENPEYFNNPTTDYRQDKWSATGMDLISRDRLFDLAGYLAWEGDTTESLNLLEDIWKLDQPSAPFDVPYISLGAYPSSLGFVSYLSPSASDVRRLQRMASEIELEFVKQPDFRFLGEYYILLANQMLKDGYIKRMPETRLDWAEVRYDKYFYLKQQEKAGKDGPFIQSLKKLRDIELGTNLSHLPILKFFRYTFPYRTARLAALGLYDSAERHDRFRQEAYTSHCLLKVALAQRLAELEGKAISSPDDLVPVYLPAIPDDPYNLPGKPAASDTTGVKTLRYDPASQQFYSVGEDGADATGDEILLYGFSPQPN